MSQELKHDNLCWQKENMQPTSTKTNQCLVPDIDDELRELIDQHNKRIWAAQNSEYDLNGRRVRRGNATVVAAPSKVKYTLSLSHFTNKWILIISFCFSQKQIHKQPWQDQKASVNQWNTKLTLRNILEDLSHMKPTQKERIHRLAKVP